MPGMKTVAVTALIALIVMVVVNKVPQLKALVG